jgi:PhnB protein
MCFIMTPGNNVHTNLAPDSRAEADRLFSALAAGDTVDMPLQGMF